MKNILNSLGIVLFVIFGLFLMILYTVIVVLVFFLLPLDIIFYIGWNKTPFNDLLRHLHNNYIYIIKD